VVLWLQWAIIHHKEYQRMADSDVKAIRHIREVKEVNAYLDAGWVFKGMTPGTTEDGSAWPLYTLAWEGKGEPVKVNFRDYQ